MLPPDGVRGSWAALAPNPHQRYATLLVVIAPIGGLTVTSQVKHGTEDVNHNQGTVQ